MFISILMPLQTIILFLCVFLVCFKSIEFSGDTRKMEGVPYFIIVLFFNVYFSMEYLISKIGVTWAVAFLCYIVIVSLILRFNHNAKSPD